jgi:hypothetical protein
LSMKRDEFIVSKHRVLVEELVDDHARAYTCSERTIDVENLRIILHFSKTESRMFAEK